VEKRHKEEEGTIAMAGMGRCSYAIGLISIPEFHLDKELDEPA
jgi:hypothetical protein